MALRRVLTSVDASWLVAGSMIGSGIFFTPGLVAERLPGTAWPLAAWLLGGVVAVCGAATYGELGARLPHAGGDYQYLATAYGPLWGFMNGWAAITLTFSAAAAAQTRSALQYLGAAWPGFGDVLPSAVFVVAPLTVLLLTGANAVGARFGGKTTALFTAVPLAVLAILFGYGALTGEARLALPAAPADGPPLAGRLSAMGIALVPIFFTYSGWNAAAYLAGEMKQPGRSLARGLLIGTLLVTVFYVLVNLALLAVLGSGLAGAGRPAADAVRLLLGGSGERLLTGMIAIAILGSANVTLMAGARVYYAMAVDGLAPRALARTPRSGVPTTALWVGGIWSALLALVGDIGDLVDWATLAIVLLSSMTVTSLFVLRRRDPQGTSFRCPGYPFTPAIFLITSAGVAVASFRFDPTHALIGLLIIAAGIPIYFVARRTFARG